MPAVTGPRPEFPQINVEVDLLHHRETENRQHIAFGQTRSAGHSASVSRDSTASARGAGSSVA